jgi:hypothetical protein
VAQSTIIAQLKATEIGGRPKQNFDELRGTDPSRGTK